ncbi:MAG: glycosyltransferase family 4 protein [bacterium]
MRDESPRRTILAVSQVYPPDPASLGQHLSDAAIALARRGHDVTVFTASRGYDDPSRRYVGAESVAGVRIRRFPLSSFGKRSLVTRLAGGISFVVQAVWHGLRMRRVDTVLITTSPQVAGVAGIVLAWLKGARLVYWVMDLNPDQAIALGIANHSSLWVRAYDAMNRLVLKRADAVVAMDRFMARRLTSKVDVGGRMHIIPPWPHEDHITPLHHYESSFRAAHGLRDKFVVMYSGNHTLANPLRTVINAALALQHDPRFAFVFIGGGTARAEVEQSGAINIRCFPFEQLDAVSHSLAAADLHVVTMGNDMVGILHPCKVYGAFAASRPILYVGPVESHVGELLAAGNFGWRAAHGDVDATVKAIREAAALDAHELADMGAHARAYIRARLSKERLCVAFCDVVAGAGDRSVPLVGPRTTRFQTSSSG